MVGSDDKEYNWIINENDWDNGCDNCTKKIAEYKDVKDFHIYFYVYDTPTDEPALDSNEFRKKIFGFADIIKLEKNKYPKGEEFYPHHIKIKNLRLFIPKITLEEFQDRLEYYDWSENQIKKFGRTLATHGLLLTEKDCKFLQSFKFITEDEYRKRKMNRLENLIAEYYRLVKEYKRNKMDEEMVKIYREALEILIIKSIDIWNALDNKISAELLEFYRNELENDLKNIIIDFPNVLEDEKFIEAKSEINQTLDMVNKTLEKLGM